MSSLGLAGLSLLFGTAYSHSWLHCSNYKAVISGQDFDESQCDGYIRYWSSQWGATSFSTDRGVNYFGSDGAWCQSGYDSDIADMYDSGYPYADYYIGDTIRLVWPAKNHANYDCFGNIPDTSMKIYYNPTVNDTKDLSDLDDWTEFADFHDGCTAGTDGCGFQNCPEFCDDTDGAPCYGDVEISSSDFSESGFYTFMWYWEFNQGSGVYTTCYEAFVHTTGTGDGGAATPSPTSPTPEPTTPAPTPPTEEPTRQPTAEGETYSPTAAPVAAECSVGTTYLVYVPICYTGASYDEDTVINGANDAFGDCVVDWEIRETSEGSSSFNVSLQTFTDYAGTVTATAYDYSTESSTLCDAIVSEFGTGSCEVCTPGEIKLYTTSNTDSDSDTDSSDSGETPESAAQRPMVALASLVSVGALLVGMV